MFYRMRACCVSGKQRTLILLKHRLIIPRDIAMSIEVWRFFTFFINVQGSRFPPRSRGVPSVDWITRSGSELRLLRNPRFRWRSALPSVGHLVIATANCQSQDLTELDPILPSLVGSLIQRYIVRQHDRHAPLLDGPSAIVRKAQKHDPPMHPLIARHGKRYAFPDQWHA